MNAARSANVFDELVFRRVTSPVTGSTASMYPPSERNHELTRNPAVPSITGAP